ncbi:MAG: CopD family protein, partial [Actinomycetota bacterium]
MVTQPIVEITIGFTGPSEPVGEGFLVRLPSGAVVPPVEVVLIDEVTWRLTLPEPIVDGVVGVRWQVQAPDAHPIDGAFAFTVATPLAAANPAEATTADPTAEAGDRVVGADDAAVGGVEAAPGPGAPDDGPRAALTPSTLASLADPTVQGPPVSIEEFLAVDEGGGAGAGALVVIGRILGLGGTVVMLGVAVFAATVLTAADGERHRLVRSLRFVGLAVMAGALAEAVGIVAGADSWQAVAQPEVWPATLESAAGLAIALRLAGGAVAAGALGASLARSPSPVPARQREVVAGTMPGWVPSAGGPERAPPVPTGVRSLPVGPPVSPVVWAAMLLLLVAPTFDGHTVTSGRRLVTALVDVVHVAAGAVWVGGLVGLLVIVSGRARRHTPTGALRLGMRFSTVAALALALAGVAGVALATTVLDGVGQLVTTGWGRVLTVKIVLVAVAGAIGAYNHFQVLRSVPPSEFDHPVVAGRLRRTVTIEVVVL